MQGLISLLLAGLVVALLAAVWVTMRMLRRPPRRTYASAVARGAAGDPGEAEHPRAFEAWSLRAGRVRGGGAGDIECPVWEIAGDDPDGPVAILSPGWGDSKLGALPRVEAFAPVCSRIIAWDPPGLGESTRGSRCGLGVTDPGLVAALVGEVRRGGGLENGYVLGGWSLGAGVSIAAGALLRDDAALRGVIAEAPYRLAWTPARSVLRLAGYPYRLNLMPAIWIIGMRLGVGAAWRGFDRAECAARLRAPLLVMHGTEDEICPIEDGRGIAGAAERGAIVEIAGAGHNDVWAEERFARRATEAIRAFIAGEPLQEAAVVRRGDRAT